MESHFLRSGIFKDPLSRAGPLEDLGQEMCFWCPAQFGSERSMKQFQEVQFMLKSKTQGNSLKPGGATGVKRELTAVFWD